MPAGDVGESLAMAESMTCEDERQLNQAAFQDGRWQNAEPMTCEDEKQLNQAAFQDCCWQNAEPMTCEDERQLNQAAFQDCRWQNAIRFLRQRDDWSPERAHSVLVRG